MMRLIILLIVFLNISWPLNAQHCMDTLHIKGYYIVKHRASELRPALLHKGNVTTLENSIDVHRDLSFVPCDRINKQHPLSFWLNHFFEDTKQVFITCEKFNIKYFLSKACLPELENTHDTCSFPVFTSKTFYQTTNLNTGDVFEIYYLDAFWARINIKSDSPEADLIPSKIAQRSISPSVSAFDLYYFIRYEKVNASPSIKDTNLKIWKF